jgi:hypothetical protein
MSNLYNFYILILVKFNKKKTLPHIEELYSKLNNR